MRRSDKPSETGCAFAREQLTQLADLQRGLAAIAASQVDAGAQAGAGVAPRVLEGLRRGTTEPVGADPILRASRRSGS